MSPSQPGQIRDFEVLHRAIVNREDLYEHRDVLEDLRAILRKYVRDSEDLWDVHDIENIVSGAVERTLRKTYRGDVHNFLAAAIYETMTEMGEYNTAFAQNKKITVNGKRKRKYLPHVRLDVDDDQRKEFLDVASNDVTTQPERALLIKEKQEQINAAWQSCDERQRIVIERHLLDGEPYKTIADDLGISAGYPGTIQARGIERMRTHLDKNY